MEVKAITSLSWDILYESLGKLVFRIPNQFNPQHLLGKKLKVPMIILPHVPSPRLLNLILKLGPQKGRYDS